MTYLWKKIKEAPIYSICIEGLVRNDQTGHILTNYLNKGPRQYYKVCLQKPDGKHKNFRVHRILAQAFIPNPKKLPQVNHIDGNKLNNNINILEWVTNSENQLHSYAIGLAKSRKGEKHHKAKLTEEDIHTIINLLKSGYNYDYISDKFNIRKSYIYEIKTFRTWKHVKREILK